MVDIDKIKKFIEDFRQDYPVASKVVDDIHNSGGQAVVVGGAVRDLLLGVPTKDIDIEVYNLEPGQLEKVLSNHGVVSLIGKSFGVFCLHGINIDWSLPRSDSAGRKPKVAIDPHMKFIDAFRRRDLTVNAMGINLQTGELIDPFNGQQDLADKKLRYVDKKLFDEDPLRFYRVMQFIGRFEMLPGKELNDLCSSVDISIVSKERIESEFSKLFLRSKRPSLGIRWLQSIGRLEEVLPQLYKTVGIEQDSHWHPEGDVFEHTMQVLDVAANIEYQDDQERLTIMWAAACHDLGKAVSTQKVNGKIRSTGHAQSGVAIAKNLLNKVSDNKDLIKTVCTLVRYHMEPLQFTKGGAGIVAYKRLANKLSPTSMRLLAKLCLADRQGRNKDGFVLKDYKFVDDELVSKFVDKSQEAIVFEKKEEPVLQGRDLLDNIKPGPELGQVLECVYKYQIEEGVQNKVELKAFALKKMKRFKKK